jgi:hypothetical protein
MSKRARTKVQQRLYDELLQRVGEANHAMVLKLLKLARSQRRWADLGEAHRRGFRGTMGEFLKAERRKSGQPDMGYKALALKLHPDVGGSAEAMSRLNRVRERLLASAA